MFNWLMNLFQATFSWLYFQFDAWLNVQKMLDNFTQTAVAFILFTLEWFHIWGHTLILFRVRLLPRKDLVRIRLYFLFDLLTVFTSSILFTGKLRWLAVLQILQHAYYFIFWDKTGLARKVTDLVYGILFLINVCYKRIVF